MLAQEEIDKLVDGEEDEESSVSAFADTMLNDNDDDTRSKLEPGSYKEHPEHVSDDDEKTKKDEENKGVVTKKEVVDMSGSQEIRKEQKQTPIPPPIRSPRNDLSLDTTISEELAATVTPTTATSFKIPSTTTRQKKSFSHRTRNLPGSIAGMCRRRGLIHSHIKNKFITREFFAEKIKEVLQHFDKDREVFPVDISGMVSKAFAAHAQKMIEELFRQHMQNTTLNLYPKSRSSTATKSFAGLQQQLYQTIKAKPQRSTQLI
ncbi:hypothetical protein Tco_0302711 [Tanacetum coccineum]